MATHNRRGHTQSRGRNCLAFADLHQRRANLHALAGLDGDGRHGAFDTRLQLVEHLHRLDDHEHGPALHRIAGRDADLDDDTRKRRYQAPEAVDEAVCLLAAPTAATDRLDLVASAGNLHVEGGCVLRDEDLDETVVQDEDVTGAIAEALERDGAPFAIDVDAQSRRRLFDLGLDFAVAQP